MKTARFNFWKVAMILSMAGAILASVFACTPRPAGRPKVTPDDVLRAIYTQASCQLWIEQLVPAGAGLEFKKIAVFAVADSASIMFYYFDQLCCGWGEGGDDPVEKCISLSTDYLEARVSGQCITVIEDYTVEIFYVKGVYLLNLVDNNQDRMIRIDSARTISQTRIIAGDQIREALFRLSN